MGKIIEMPDSLERRAQKIEAALDQQDDANERTSKADSDWKEATFVLAVELAAAKKDLKTTNAFGKWCNERFGENRLTINDRASLARWGANPEETRAMLVNETSRSIQMIDRRLCNATKSPFLSVGGAKTKSVHAAIQTNEALGNKLSQKDLAEMLGVSTSTVGEATRDLKAARVAETITYTKAQEYHIEARVKAIVKARLDELEKEFEARVIAKNQEEIAKLFPDLEELQKAAALNERYYREMVAKEATLTLQEWHDLVFLAHNKEVSEERKKRAAQTLIINKLRLTGEK